MILLGRKNKAKSTIDFKTLHASNTLFLAPKNTNHFKYINLLQGFVKEIRYEVIVE